MKNQKISIESWDPGYGSPSDFDTIEQSNVDVEISIEKKQNQWKPIKPASNLAKRILFADGVRRTEAIVWVSREETSPVLGLCASVAAGVLEAEEKAKIIHLEVKRGLFTSTNATNFETSIGDYEPKIVAGNDLNGLSNGIQIELRRLEGEIASKYAKNADLIVLDGPLDIHQKIQNAIGYIKSHHKAYLPESVADVLSALGPGERTPIFLITTSWTRFSWYSRLPCSIRTPFDGIVRNECPAELELAEVQKLANLATCSLPKYASQEYKDSRAPQNLAPIAGLENDLRHHLGNMNFVRRALTKAAHG